ncbi:hypothetical protein LTR53_015922 [Teratosphaeriaceae sp. CCFEE 6253]|nr:hypothetical protein LTR53_015922 [Teratosphaeriaceae sp. CCFEE 6253]
MATPTPTIPSHPSSASKRAGGQVSTPAHLGFSPPRSVPSPATLRKDHAGKTPINHPTTSSHGSKTLGGTPMIHSLSQQGHTGSPSANMLSFGTPVGLGVEGITPGTFNMATPAMVSIPMGLTLSDLGATPGATAPKRNEDEERRLKMRRILKKIGAPKGRVSHDAIVRVSRRAGFDVATDTDTKLLSIAGRKVLIDVAMKDHKPDTATAVFATENAGLQAQTQAVATVLLDDLHNAGQVSLSAKLDGFAANLERLAALDRLSSEHLDAFEALSGIHTSLRRLYELESAVASDLEVMRRKSGKPVAHLDGRIGLGIAYWHSTFTEQDKVKGSIDDFKLSLGIEHSSAALYPSIRVSHSWLPDPLELAVTDSELTIPWQEPDATLIPTSSQGNAMAIDGDEKLPDLRFAAKLEPPIVLPWHVATHVLQSFGVPAPQLFVLPPSWHSMLLDPTNIAPFNAVNPHTVTAQHSVLLSHEGKDAETTHTYALDVVKPDGGYRLAELPFAHPRQLVEALPTLRQWAFFGSLVQRVFAGSAH